jgi:tRNA threonylcarbamoyladenosine biosynthesis protein TsaB
MALLLNIDTATEHASVCLSENDIILTIEESHDQKNHGSFLQPAIQKMVSNSNIQLPAIDAIAVTIGPGSYTGLRVGLASAKGLCFALNKPLIVVNTLEVIACASIKAMKQNNHSIDDFLFCPLIDARRMEVFTAIYTKKLKPVIEPAAMIITENSFSEFKNNKIVFSGSGHNKVKNIINNKNFIFLSSQHNASHLSVIAQQQFDNKQFANLAYCEPLYLKEFFNTQSKKQ